MTRGTIHLQVRDTGLRRALCDACRQTAIVASAFILLVLLAMAVSLVRDRRDDLITPTRIEQLKRQLASDSSNAVLKERIRTEDERLRLAHFERRVFLLHGAWLLLGAAIVAALCAKLAGTLGATPYLPTGAPPIERRWEPALRNAIAFLTLILLGGMLILRFPWIGETRFDRLATVPESHPAPSPQPVQMASTADWLGFRGPSGIGIATGDYPTQWDGGTGKNILWRASVPMPGHNSPIVASSRVFLSGGNEQRREIYCFDAQTGSLQWTRAAGVAGSAGLHLSEDTGWAPSTMASDGQRVFGIFPNGDLVCLDLEGRPVWSKSMGVPKNQYGHASSLLAWADLLFVQFDQGTNAKQGLSVLYAFECATGKQRWKMNRPVPASWSTPAIVPGPAGPQLITLANPWVIAYDPATGSEIWRANGLAGEIVPSPTFGQGLLFAAVDQAGLVSIRLDGRGDVTGTHLRKIDAEVPPDIVSPVAIGSRVLLVSSGGTLSLIDAVTGKTVWSQDIDGGFHASPIVVGPNVYLTDLQGVTHVLEIGETFKENARCPLGQAVVATPALSGGRIFIRGKTDLFCIGAPTKGVGQ